MKKIVFAILIVTLFSITTAFSVKLGIAAKNWDGCIDGSYHRGIYVVDTLEGFPSYGILKPGDIISEALLIPYFCSYSNNCCPQRELALSFDACNRLVNQLCQLKCICVPYQYEKIYNWNLLCLLLEKAGCNSTMVFRVFRTTTCEWMMVSVRIDNYGKPVFCCTPCYYECTTCVPCICNPCSNNYYSKNCYCCTPCQYDCGNYSLNISVYVNP